ncbi:hypothetical protein AvCA_02210 [Azotobacter vinelandii CA]|uniref:Probable membrane transporter protein n=2 Tax=Azotobacter vinelandii TaxID=354 RepID=C1DH75_AZOVD|nr:sulfite exporter TauE/SafE family protein [Azotobacter vinelandii]ACO76482.1 conserved hypothetical protein [Azotobacter vinelandii DJ]AGK17385.1 hypothetical protein AvCA_02210 [Azotobacter vinelandii CA]AGK19153.1 hypothetical protein AvCA6_02210 [Azotobacter vinelandii CA6]WKN22257.1 sulfite exporter TauE/SafE family protein [Azotobacter vinelandii]SFX08984.1 Uncharacterized membrane protein YfcA [Azotobacter vinelandii]
MTIALSLGIFFVAGLAGGLLLGLIGVGMALITVPLLIMALPMFGFDPEHAPLVALATSMAVVSVGSVSSVFSHNKLGNVDWSIVRIVVPASLIGVGLGSLSIDLFSGTLLKWLFCIFLSIIAVRMLLPTKKKTANDAIDTTAPWVYRSAGGLIGIAGSLIGAGGGVFMVPFLNRIGHAMPRAVATSTTIGLPVTVFAAIVHASQSSPPGDSAMLGHIYLPAFIGLGLGSVLTAPLGARFSSRVPAELLKRVFAWLLIALVVKLALSA